MIATGLDVLAGRGFDLLKGRRVGLIANQTSVDVRLRHAADLFREALGTSLVRLFAPEHGLRGDAQDMVAVAAAHDAATGCEVESLYGATLDSLAPSAAATGDLDTLVFDVQDVGSRYYTFAATLLLAMKAARERGLEVIVLDRPNPLGGERVEGNVVQEGFESFVGLAPLAVRHGMTVGEIAAFGAAHLGYDAKLTVVPMEGWARRMSFEQTGLPWVMPSPNMPTPDTARVYPGMCLVEGTNLSEGRGTTRPFELIGAPWLDGGRLGRTLAAENLPGVVFREASFRPTFQKHAGVACHGVQVHVVDEDRFEPFRTGVRLLVAARAQEPARFAWRSQVYEFVSDRLAFDLLAGDDRLRPAIESGRDYESLAASWQDEMRVFLARRAAVLLY